MHVEFNESLVAFLDILGFKNKILSNQESSEDYFSSVIQEIDGLKIVKEGLKAILISDSIVLSFPNITRNNFRELCVAVARIQVTLAKKNIWLRGAITYGGFFSGFRGENDWAQVTVGQGLSDAYVMESRWAIYPRVIIDPKLILKLSHIRSDLIYELNDPKSLLRTPLFDYSAVDDQVYKLPITYLEPDAVWVNYGEILCRNREDLNQVIDFIRLELYSGNDHYKKYKWLQHYLYYSFGQTRDEYGPNQEDYENMLGYIKKI